MSLRYYLAIAGILGSVLWWFFFNIAVIFRGCIAACPRCATRRIRRSVPRWYDAALPAFISPRRCESCLHRFYTLASFRYRQRPEIGPPARPLRRPELASSAR